MSKETKGKKISKDTKKNSMIYLVLAGIVVIALAGFIFSNLAGGQGGTGPSSATDAKGNELASTENDLTILKSEVSEKVKFYPYKTNDVYMEIMAVKASDGTVRTALNTCQVCFDSGRGYYEQNGNKVVCQNCGNVFRIDDIEKVKNGCNPVPILKEDKTEDNDKIVISNEYLKGQIDFFKKWKR